jgi:hypothetical protein
LIHIVLCIYGINEISRRGPDMNQENLTVWKHVPSVVCSRVHVLFSFLIAHSGVHHKLCCDFVLFRLVYTMLPVSLECPCFIAPSIFSNVYLILCNIRCCIHNVSLCCPYYILNMLCSIKWKTKQKYHTVCTVPKSDWNIVDVGSIDTTNTQIHDRWLTKRDV